MMAVLASFAVLHPLLGQAADLRLASDGAGAGTEVHWLLDGREVAVTLDRQAASVPASAGSHLLVAESAASAGWLASARPDLHEAGLSYAQAWVARAVPAERQAIPDPSPAMVMAAVCLLAIGRRSKIP